MKLLPPSMWRSSENQVANSQEEDQHTTLPSRLWRSFVGEPPTKRSQPLEKRKDKTTTITDTVTNSVTETIFINNTVTIFSTTKFFITTNITFFHTTTITDNFTTTTPVTISVPFTVSATDSTTLLPPPIPSTIHIPSKTKAVAEIPASTSASPVPITATPQHHLSTIEILAIVFGILGVLGLAIGVLFLVRRFYRMYRRERVLRKQLQTEGAEMPVMKTGQSLRNDECVGGGGGD